MKWNWGYGLTIVFIAFASNVGFLVYKCTQEKFDLVSADYYNEELKYQDKIDGMQNAKQLSAVQLVQTGDEVSIQLPKELNGHALTGQVWLYCPANAALDYKAPLQVNEDGVMLIDKKKLADAKYTAKITWETGDTKYYNEQSLTIAK
ncbi:hypothetical protein FC093_01635 [Ilyomonas limi]|uniref:FixH family protein n=1 Tax=Ilyomonas limi TaxID=2575867 RepID=A0A4U3L9G4_9BACT|nr:FixH family protein [Ilyomonas limi]TKK71750.1 hypothetical protein FC093_01635 [Ilyomonas limi]